MWWLILYLVAVVGICALSLWHSRDSSPGRPAASDGGTPAAVPEAAEPGRRAPVKSGPVKSGPVKSGPVKSGPEPPEPTTLEGVLVADLAGRGISRNQYRRAMEQLAARDEQRHPLTVPSPAGPVDQ